MLVYIGGVMDRGFIDQPLFSFRELLALLKIGRGTVEGYMKRGVVVPSASDTKGSGHHRQYSGRDLLKFAAVAFMTKAGLSPEYVAWAVADEIELKVDPKTGMVLERGRSQFASLIDEYIRIGPSNEFWKKSPFVFNTVAFAPHLGVTGIETGGLMTLDDPRKLLDAQRKWDAVTYLVFDAPLFVWSGCERLERYLTQRGGQK
jgi:hypothetical protein